MRQNIQYERVRSNSEEDIEIELSTMTQSAQESHGFERLDLFQALQKLDEKAKEALNVLDETFSISTTMENEYLLNHNRDHLLEIERMIHQSLELLQNPDNGKRLLLISFPWDEYYLDRNTHFPSWNTIAHEINRLVNEIHEDLLLHDTHSQQKHEKQLASYTVLCRTSCFSMVKHGWLSCMSIPSTLYVICLLFAAIMVGWYYFTTKLFPSAFIPDALLPDHSTNGTAEHIVPLRGLVAFP